MSSTDVSGETGEPKSALGVDMTLEVVTLPVADVDRAKAFYESLGWRLDIDLVISDEVRNVQFTPPTPAARSNSARAGRPLSRVPPRP
jgi:catechol 2,3-dioxygenase-like lactoylglutathione lyase family enzyme